MVLGLINGLAGETETISEVVGAPTRLLVLEEGETDLAVSMINESIIDALKHPKVKQVLPQRISYVSVHFGESASFAEVLGVNQTAFLEFFTEATIEEGTAPPKDKESFALIGSQLAKKWPNLKNNLPTDIIVSRGNMTEQFTVTVTGIINGKGHYLDDLILSPSTLVTVFPESSEKISFVELRLKDTTGLDETIDTLLLQARNGGYHIQIVAEQSQTQVADHIMEDIMGLFWIFGVFAFFIVSIQTYFAVKWIAVHYRTEFATLRCLGSSKRSIGSILLFDVIILGNIALIFGLVMGILAATALMAIVTIFTENARFYASVDLWNTLIVGLFANLAVIIGSLKQVKEIGRRTLTVEVNSTAL